MEETKNPLVPSVGVMPEKNPLPQSTASSSLPIIRTFRIDSEKSLADEKLRGPAIPSAPQKENEAEQMKRAGEEARRAEEIRQARESEQLKISLGEERARQVAREAELRRVTQEAEERRKVQVAEAIRIREEIAMREAPKMQIETPAIPQVMLVTKPRIPLSLSRIIFLCFLTTLLSWGIEAIVYYVFFDI